MVDGYSKNSSGFGINQKSNWYASNIGRNVSLFIQGSMQFGGVIHDVNLEDGEVILKPYMGKTFSSGKELEALVDEEQRINIAAIMVKRVHPDNYFTDYLGVFSPNDSSVIL